MIGENLPVPVEEHERIKEKINKMIFPQNDYSVDWFGLIYGKDPENEEDCVYVRFTGNKKTFGDNSRELNKK